MKQIYRFFLALLFAGLLWLLSCLLTFGYLIYRPLTLTTPIELLVPAGSNATAIVYQLEQLKAIKNPSVFLAYLKLRAATTRIKTGSYLLMPPLSLASLLDKLVAGSKKLARFTIVNGWTYARLKQAILATDSLQPSIVRLPKTDVMPALGYNIASPEGMFYPDTYLYDWGIADQVILKLAADRMQRVLTTAWAQRAKGLPYKNAYAALITASLIEKETALASERRQIAGVIVRRLKKRMHLQIDAAVIFGLGKQYRHQRLTRANLRQDTPYNIYRHYGLPPTPIAFPSKASIVAALHPAAGNALYYVAKGDGSHVFTASLAAHDRAIRRYLVPIRRARAAAKKRRQAHAQSLNLSAFGQSYSATLLHAYWRRATLAAD